jgi:hypothetical protein
MIGGELVRRNTGEPGWVLMGSGAVVPRRVRHGVMGRAAAWPHGRGAAAAGSRAGDADGHRQRDQGLHPRH